MDKIHKIFEATMEKAITPHRICCIILKKLLKINGILLSRSQIEKISSDILDTGVVEIKVRKEQIKRFEFKSEKSFEEFFKKVLDKLPSEIDNVDSKLDSIIEKATINTIDESVRIIRRSIRKNMAEGLNEREALRIDFEYNMYRKWGKALDALEMFIVLAYECGDNFNSFFRAKAVAENDLIFEVLAGIHARACQVAYEIFTLLKAGYADGAHARWRSLHELVVVGAFIRDSGQHTAERYLLHEKIDNYKEAISCNDHCDSLGYDKISDLNMSNIIKEKDLLIERFGSEYYSSYGWACNALGKKRVDFYDIEREVKLDHYRPFYKMACNNIHAGSKGNRFRLGLSGSQGEILLAGPSNVGLYDPGIGAATSLNQITVLLMTYEPTFDSIIRTKVLLEFLSDVESKFYKAEEKLNAEILLEQQKIASN